MAPGPELAAGGDLMEAVTGAAEAISPGYGDAVRQLSGLQKTAKGAPAYSRFVNRWFGRRLAALAYVAGATPNQVTAVSAAFTFTGIAVIALVRPSPAEAVAVCIALVLGYALDSADGQLARLRGGGSPAGEWLDHVIDSAKISTVHAAVLIAVFRFFGLHTATPLLIPIGYGAVTGLWFFTVVLTDQLRRSHQQTAAIPAHIAGGHSVLKSVLVLPTDYGVLCLVFLALPEPRLFLTLYGALLAGNLLFLLAALPKWYGEMASFGRSPASQRADGTA
jgi:phosphatidylglycerophosphate synthase